ncbi:transcription regulator levR [Lactiplantibacillus plantarum]|nr:transcription regulator levR [Lactiplantibacillus plantarum]
MDLNTVKSQMEQAGVSDLFGDELSNQAQLFAEENFTWTFPSQDLAWTVI